MGLDLYVRKTRHQGNYELTEDNYIYVVNEAETRSDAELARDYSKCIKTLTEAETNKVDSETYARLHKECIDFIKKHFDYPEYELDKIGYGKEFRKWDDPENHDTRGYYEEVYKPVPVDTWIHEMSHIIEVHSAPAVCYFRKVNFIFAYFENNGNLIDQYFAFMDKETCLDIIDRCKRVLADHSLAGELLPTQPGFFFGSTNYDEWYYRDVENVMKQLTEKALPVYDELCWEKGYVLEENENEKMNMYWIFSW